MASTYTCLLYHFVFSTKDRRPWMTPEIRPRLHAYIGKLIANHHAVALAIGGVEDHVHLLVQANQQCGIPEMMRDAKAISSKWVHDTLHIRDFGWQTGYGAFTVSASQKEKVLAYIANQAKHHRRRTFQEELERLLTAHCVEFDPKYLL